MLLSRHPPTREGFPSEPDPSSSGPRWIFPSLHLPHVYVLNLMGFNSNPTGDEGTRADGPPARPLPPPLTKPGFCQF